MTTTSSDDSMLGRVCLVTGANSGIGKETALGLARRGATVLMVCRDPDRGAAAARVVTAASSTASVELFLADLSSQASIRVMAGRVIDKHPHLHVLVNNAGAAFPKRQVSVDGIELTFALNHLAYFLVTTLLSESLKAGALQAGAPARIVSVSSDIHSRGRIDFDDIQGVRRYNGVRAYAQSKLANVAFTRELARRLAGTGVTANCLNPGGVRSSFASSSGGALRVLSALGRPFMITPAQAAEAVLHLATSAEVDGATGGYYFKQRLTDPARRAQDPATAQRLWELSEELAPAVGSHGAPRSRRSGGSRRAEPFG